MIKMKNRSTPISNKAFLITGGSGFIGSMLAGWLVDSDIDACVRVLRSGPALPLRGAMTGDDVDVVTETPGTTLDVVRE